MALDSAQMLKTVERSPACVAAHDKAGWLELFSSDGEVEDPVGSAVNRKGAHRDPANGEDDLSRFYETFIAGNEIRFEVAMDLVAGSEVVRDVIIHTRLGTGLDVAVPAYLIYQVVEESGVPRIRRLRACWDLRRRSIGSLLSGWRGLWTLTAMSAHMMSVQRPRWVLEYSRGMTSGVFATGARAAEALARAATSRDVKALAALFAPGGEVEFPASAPKEPQALLDRLADGGGLRIQQATSAGWLTGFRFEADWKSAPATRGIGFLEFDRVTKRISRARFFGPVTR